MNLMRHASNKVMTVESIPENIKLAKYAVRGEMVIRANALADKLRKGEKMPFEKIVYCNIGNPQELGQMPITFFRQVLSLVEYPQLLEHESVGSIFPADAIKRAKKIIKEIGSTTGAYTHSQGYPFVRRDIAKYIARRDGYDGVEDYCNPDHIYITDGASPGVQKTLSMLIRDQYDGIMIPIPQYPLYSATIPLLGGSAVPYFLDESENWGLSIESLQEAVNQAKAKGVRPKGIVVINPGNPTGGCLTQENMTEIVKFCSRENIVLLADEVYQENVYVKETKPFVSFKKAIYDMGETYRNQELISYHSISKGFVGECGHRGGYFECTNIDPQVQEEIYKLQSINLCPNVTGQLLVDLMVNPPKEGEESYQLYYDETVGIYNSLKRRAERVGNTLNNLPLISCNTPEGAMYAFPQITLTPKFIEEAKAAKKTPDLYYCLQLLDQKGICVVPGSGFGQVEGTFHFRTTFLPQEEDFDKVMNDLSDFHMNYVTKYN